MNDTELIHLRFCSSKAGAMVGGIKNAKNWHTRCARWWNDFNIEHALNTRWKHSEHTLNTLWSPWTHSEHTLNTHWTHSEHTLNTLWTHSEHTLNTLWAHSEHTLKICPRFDKISKTTFHHWLSNMDPRDASASKNPVVKAWNGLDSRKGQYVFFYWS